MEKRASRSAVRHETFISNATLAIDATGRTNLPKDFRKVLAVENRGRVVVTFAENHTLALFPLSEWNRYVKDLIDRGRGPDVSKFRSLVISKAKLSELDSQNRITLTPEQMRHAGIRDAVTFAGDGNRVRLWSPERYDAEINTLTPEEEIRFANLY